jgi:tRNA(His) guanylyltransferase
MNVCAVAVLEEFPDVVCAYGHSDEYSFVLRKQSSLYDRRASKLTSVIVSLFTANYVMRWAEHLGPETPLQRPPAFDARAVLYPSDQTLRDYLSWRQADCHINNQYNSCFWALVQQGGCSREEAQAALRGTLAEEKNELLFSRFGINYAELPALERRGSVVYRRREGGEVKPGVVRERSRTLVEHVDIIGDAFWATQCSIFETEKA